MSGYPDDIIARSGVLDTNVDFLLKPFSRDQIAVKVREVLARA
jgi:FixJ family two-component response regulator